MAREATVKVTLDDKQVQPIVRRLVEAHREHIRAQMLAEVLAFLRGLDPVEAALAGQHAFIVAADLLADRFSSVPEQEGERG